MCNVAPIAIKLLTLKICISVTMAKKKVDILEIADGISSKKLQSM